jgi:hypothetical protein
MRGVPARALERAVSLQLLQLTGITRMGFVFRTHNGKVAVWYWNETAAAPERMPEVTAAQIRNGIAFWPETLLGRLPANGLHLMRRIKGYEALALEDGEIRCTRWFADLPDARKWSGFVRDAGYSQVLDMVPQPQPAALSRKAPKGWKLSSHVLARVPLAALGVAAFTAFLGAALLTMAIYQIKLEQAIRVEDLEVERIAQENAAAFDLQKKIAASSAYLDQLRRVQPEALQLELMQALAESGLMTDERQVSLLEWEYRGQQLRLLFSVPPKLALVDFLARLETLPMLKDIRLLPDTPAQTVGVQATLLSWRFAPSAVDDSSSPSGKAEAAADSAPAPGDTGDAS